TGFFLPSLVDVNVTGRARAGAAAFSLDLRHAVLDRRLHDGRADLAFDGPRSAAGIDVGDFHHGNGCNGRSGRVQLEQRRARIIAVSIQGLRSRDFDPGASIQDLAALADGV